MYSNIPNELLRVVYFLLTTARSGIFACVFPSPENDVSLNPRKKAAWKSHNELIDLRCGRPRKVERSISSLRRIFSWAQLGKVLELVCPKSPSTSCGWACNLSPSQSPSLRHSIAVMANQNSFPLLFRLRERGKMHIHQTRPGGFSKKSSAWQCLRWESVRSIE